MTELRKALERPVADLVFDENRKNAVREKAFTAKRGGSALRRGAAVALVCTVLCVTAVAAGPTLWDALEARLGPYAPFAAEVEGETSGQGLRLELVKAVSDGYTARVYYTLTDETGDRKRRQPGGLLRR